LVDVITPYPQLAGDANDILTRSLCSYAIDLITVTLIDISEIIRPIMSDSFIHYPCRRGAFVEHQAN